MAGKLDLSKMSLDELKSLRKEVEKAISGFKDRQRLEAMKEIQAVAKKHGLPLEDIVGKKAGKSKAKSPAKYRDPDNPTNTWSGRGRQPEWYKNAISKGKKPEQMAI